MISSDVAISRLSRVVTVSRRTIHVAVLDVPAIFAEVDGDAVGAAERGEDRGRDRVRLLRAPGLPHGRHVIDVHAEADHLPYLAR